MFPKPNRLPHEAFSRVFTTGIRLKGEDFQIVYTPNNLTVSRFMVQVGVKIDKRASKRNRMKRLLRESIRHLLPIMKQGFDFIIIAQKNLSDQKEKEIEHSLKGILDRFHIPNNGIMEQ